MTALKGKVALVTGGSRGMGAAIAVRLAQDGADVALTYVSSPDKAHAVAAEIERAGARALAIAADSADPAVLRWTVEETVAAFGRLDVLVSNAGIYDAKPLEAVTVEDFDRTVAVNTRAVFIAAQAASRHMGEGGRIVTIGSNLAERVPGPDLTLYSLSKAALVGLTKGLARDLGPRGIRVSLVQPGSTDTDMNPADSEHAEPQRQLMAIPRFGESRDVASLVAWLAGPESRFATGTVFTIDGGANA